MLRFVVWFLDQTFLIELRHVLCSVWFQGKIPPPVESQVHSQILQMLLSRGDLVAWDYFEQEHRLERFWVPLVSHDVLEVKGC